MEKLYRIGGPYTHQAKEKRGGGITEESGQGGRGSRSESWEGQEEKVACMEVNRPAKRVSARRGGLSTPHGTRKTVVQARMR